MTTTYYRAVSESRRDHVAVGACWTTSEGAAESYLALQTSGVLQSVEVDLDGLQIVEVDAYDRDDDYAVGDCAEDLERLRVEGVDAITYDDEDVDGQAHRTVRLISDRAVARYAEAV